MNIKALLLMLVILNTTIHSLYAQPTYIKPPQTIEMAENVTVFLAGGCTVPWREKLKNLLNDEKVTLLDPIGSEIERPYWEQMYINKADVLLLWIPQQGECRGSLVELGRFLEMKDRPLFIGVDPCSLLYKEIFIQVKLRPEIKIVTSLEELSLQLINFLHKS